MKINDIVEYAERIAPSELAEGRDNVGLLAGSGEYEVSRVLLALDITTDVVREAAEKGAGLIISHHPVIFDTFRTLEPDTAPYLLAKNDIAALCLHTNLDRAERGVNIALAEALGLRNVTLYAEDFLAVGEAEREMSADEFAVVIKEKLGAPSVRYTDGKVSRVAVSSGGGGEGVELSRKYGFDAFVTGEMKHHLFILAKERNIAAFDAGHYPTENVVIAPLREMLAAEFPTVEFIVSESCKCPYKSV